MIHRPRHPWLPAREQRARASATLELAKALERAGFVSLGEASAKRRTPQSVDEAGLSAVPESRTRLRARQKEGGKEKGLNPTEKVTCGYLQQILRDGKLDMMLKKAQLSLS